jgi:F-type H+-transporting ATPase subunit epsilon
VTPARCSVLADEARPIATLDRAEADAQLADAQARLPDARDAAARDGSGEAERANLRLVERQYAIAAAKLDALGAAH